MKRKIFLTFLILGTMMTNTYQNIIPQVSYAAKETILEKENTTLDAIKKEIDLDIDKEPQKTKLYAKVSLNIRKGPSTEYDIIDTLSVNDMVLAGEVENGWARIEYNKIEGYVYEKYLSETPIEIVKTTQEDKDVSEASTEGESEKTPIENGVQEQQVQSIGIEGEIFQLLNEYRQQNGLAPLTISSTLNTIAGIRAEEISRYWSHTRPDGRDCYSAFTDMGITVSAGAENLAYGCSSAAEFIEGWKNSPSHNAAMLDPVFTKVGIGLFQDSQGRIYAVQEFSN